MRWTIRTPSRRRCSTRAVARVLFWDTELIVGRLSWDENRSCIYAQTRVSKRVAIRGLRRCRSGSGSGLHDDRGSVAVGSWGPQDSDSALPSPLTSSPAARQIDPTDVCHRRVLTSVDHGTLLSDSCFADNRVRNFRPAHLPNCTISLIQPSHRHILFAVAGKLNLPCLSKLRVTSGSAFKSGRWHR